MDYNDDEKIKQEKHDRIRRNLLEKIFIFFNDKEKNYQQELNKYYKLFLNVLELEPERLEKDEEFLLILHMLIIFDCPIKEGQRIIDLFKAAKQEELTEIEQEILEQFLQQPLRPYLIKEGKGKQYLIKDLFSGVENIFTAKNSEFKAGEIITGRLIKVGDENQIIGAYNTVPEEYTEFIVESMKDYYSDYSQKFNSQNFEQFLHRGSIFIIKIFKEIHNLAQEDIVYELKYRIQSRKLARKRLNEHKQVRLEESQEGFDYLLLFSNEKTRNDIIGEFIIDGDSNEDKQLYFRTEVKKILEQGKKIIEEVLSFTAVYETSYKINLVSGEIIEFLDERPEQLSEKMIQEFIGSPLPLEYGAKTPREMLKNSQDKKLLIEVIEEIELIAKLLPDDNKEFFTLDEIKEIRERLNLTANKKAVLQDGVEKLLADKMTVYNLPQQLIVDAILIWRDFKAKINQLRGRDKSWAAGVEYLVSRINYWGMTQKEVGEKYQVSSNTVSKKYRQIADELGMEN